MKVYPLNEVEVQEASKRKKTSFNEFDRVLGGGLVEGEVVLYNRKPWDREIYTFAAGFK